jgi:hypothetical protein
VNSPEIPEGGVLLHAAVLLNGEVAFEKTDSSTLDPYRLAWVADIKSKYKRALSDRANVSFVVRRFLTKETKPLPAPLQGRQIFEVDSQPETLAILEEYLPMESVSNACEADPNWSCEPQLILVTKTPFGRDPVTGRTILSEQAAKNSLIPLLK